MDEGRTEMHHMDTKERRKALLEKLKTADQPMTGTELARELGVSRQIIVGDIAILRAAGEAVYATPQGYVLPAGEKTGALTATLACRHDRDGLAKELTIMIDNGGKVLDVVVEHPVYGEIRANLMLSSRRDIADFLHNLSGSGAEPLSIVTGGVHLHTLEVPDREALRQIEKELRQEGILVN